MITAISDMEITSHRTRDLLLERIRSYPGITFTGLLKALDLNEGTLRYHLEYLERRKHVFSRKDGRKRLYFGYSDECRTMPKEEHLSQNEMRILNLIKADPRIGIAELASRIGMPRSRIGVLVRRLKRKHLVMEVEGVSGIELEYVTRERLVEEMLLDLVEKFLKGEIDRDAFLRIKVQIEDSMQS